MLFLTVKKLSPLHIEQNTLDAMRKFMYEYRQVVAEL
jgi:hypothetical protein